MNKKQETLLEVFERNVKSGTCKFKGWCDLVAWARKHNASIEVLRTLNELSESAYAAVTKEEEPKQKKPKETAKVTKPQSSKAPEAKEGA